MVKRQARRVRERRGGDGRGPRHRSQPDGARRPPGQGGQDRQVRRALISLRIANRVDFVL